MTVKRQWMLALVFSVALSVLINSLVFSTLVNRYFVEYSTENYNAHIDQLTAFATDALSGGEYSGRQLEMQLGSHLSDPINRIRLYSADGTLLADVGGTGNPMMGMMRSPVMNRVMGSASAEADSLDISKDGVLLGKLLVNRYSSIGNSLGTRRFMLSLVGYSVLSFGVVFALTFLIGHFISKKMSRDLMLTAQQAVELDLGNEVRLVPSNVKEIRTIQQSLETLQSRLKLKQTSRKKLVDELVHQTRTPLTILQTHLEGFRDGVIQFNPEEVGTCEAQISNLSSIITNMSGLIDAEKEIDAVNLAPVDVCVLIRQITAGLKAQFDRKSIALEVDCPQKMTVQTDYYKLSQAVYNLLTNAYKFTPAGGTVSVSCATRGNERIIAVQDTGVGIPLSEQAHVFDAYYRGANSVHTEGEGIGLYIVSENLRRIGGRIELQSTQGKGSRFTIHLQSEADESNMVAE